MKPILCAFLVFALVNPVLAAESDDAAKIRGFTGNEMLPHCRALVDDAAATTPMQGLFAGMITTLFWSQKALSNPLKFCAPRGVSRGQSRQVVVRYLENHPERSPRGYQIVGC